MFDGVNVTLFMVIGRSSLKQGVVTSLYKDERMLLNE